MLQLYRAFLQILGDGEYETQREMVVDEHFGSDCFYSRPNDRLHVRLSVLRPPGLDGGPCRPSFRLSFLHRLLRNLCSELHKAENMHITAVVGMYR